MPRKDRRPKTIHDAIPASTCRSKIRLIRNELIFLLTCGSPSKKLRRRFAALFRSVWDKIPDQDKAAIRRKIREYPKGLYVYLAHRLLPGTNALIRLERGEMWFDAWFAERATDRNMQAVIAHEVGHLRGWADPEWPDKGEAVAILYSQRLWEFEEGDLILKTEDCLKLDEIARQIGLKAQIFARPEIQNDPPFTFLVVKDHEQFDLARSDVDFDEIGSTDDDFEDVERVLRIYGRDEAEALSCQTS